MHLKTNREMDKAFRRRARRQRRTRRSEWFLNKTLTMVIVAIATLAGMASGYVLFLVGTVIYDSFN